jgi:hypothetical protein
MTVIDTNLTVRRSSNKEDLSGENWTAIMMSPCFKGSSWTTVMSHDPVVDSPVAPTPDRCALRRGHFFVALCIPPTDDPLLIL